MLPRGLSFLGLGDSNKVEEVKNEVLPSLNLRTDKDVYRPGDTVDITIEISNPEVELGSESNAVRSLLVERVTFEMKGIEKLDVQWFATQKPLPGSRQRRGEHVFVESSTPLILLNKIISSGVTRTYLVRTSLPSIIPPSYKGATIRYIYHVRSTLSAQWLVLENGNSRTETMKKLTQVEARIPLQVWVSQKANGLQIEGGQDDGIVPETTIQMDLCWKETDSDSDWVRANDIYDGGEDGYESSRDEISSVSSYNVTRENMHKAFGSSLSLQSSVARSSNRDSPYLEGGRTSMSSYVAIPQLSVAEVVYEPNADTSSAPQSIISPRHQQKHINPFSSDDNGGSSVPEHVEPVASEGFIRGRSYNIWLDNQVLLRFSPKNSDSTYYFSDMIGGTLTFFHEEGARRCLEVSITLETSETIDRRHVHPSRRNSPTITKVQSDYHEVVADLVQTSFLFSIPTDGPMSFSTPHISVQWSLRFEFLTTPKNVDWTRYDHPLLVENREKTEWVLPIIVHAPPGNSTTAARNDKSFFLEPLWVRT